jgi:hypothetical protein
MMRRLIAFAVLFLLGATPAVQSETPARIRTLTLEKLARISLADQERICQYIKAQPFTSETIGSMPSELMRDALQRMGYFKAFGL